MGKYDNCDFSGWATRNDLLCGDGRVIKKDAFKDNDGAKVSLVWNHEHDDPDAVLGHAFLENRDDGVYAYGYFNKTEKGQKAKELVQHGDVSAMSIWANQLKHKGNEVVHGAIRELSLVLAGSNPGAYIDFVMAHNAENDEVLDELYANYNENIVLYHSADGTKDPEPKKEENKEESKMAEEPNKNEDEETVGDVFNTLTEKQKKVVYAIIEQALETKGSDDKKDEEDNNMKHNVFEKENNENGTVLSHSEMSGIISDAKRSGSLRDAFIAHGVTEDTLSHSVTDDDGNTVTYGIANIDYLFPDARNVSNTPDFISRRMEWVDKFIKGAKHLPFSRVKSIHANITMDEARAKGYIKGHQKANEVFPLLKRTTSPTTIYKKQKLDRDDIVDITDMDVVSWLKSEMRIMLDEELARAALIGDGRIAGSDDKISEDCIRPIYSDNSTYVIRKAVTPAANDTDEDKAKAVIKAIIKARKDYKGSGNLVWFTTEDQLTDCLLIEDGNGRVIYDSIDKLKATLRVRDIVTVPVMEGITREGSGSDAGYDFALAGILVDLVDYGFGADKGGAVNMFDDFDIDFNQEKYLIETRCSGALMKPYSAIVVEYKTAST